MILNRKPSKLLALFGSEINFGSLQVITKFTNEGYVILAFDSKAISFAKKNNLPYVSLDNWINAETIYQCTVVANKFERSWYQNKALDFTHDGVCWPELDRDAMYFYWRVTTVASVFMESFLEKGGEDIHYLSFDRLPSIFYYKSDTWKTVIDMYLGKSHVDMNSESNFDKNLLMSKRVKELAGDIHILDPLVVDSWGNDRAHRMYTTSSYSSKLDSFKRKALFALNPGELYRFMPVIKTMGKEFKGEVKIYLLVHNVNLAKEWRTKLQINVFPGPVGQRINLQLQDQFFRAYQEIRNNSMGEPWNITLNVDYHFEYYCKNRWPRLSSLLGSWRDIWTNEKPAAVIVSSLMDAESQLPALAANRLGIETFSIPHTQFPRIKNVQFSKNILYDFIPYKDVLEKTGVAYDRLIACKEIVSSRPYPTHAKFENSISKSKLRILILVGNTRAGVSSADNVIIPNVLPTKHAEAINQLLHPPKEYDDMVEIKFKIHPLDPEYEIFDLADIDKEENLLPVETDLLAILDTFDVIVDLNYGGASALLPCIKKKMPLLFWWNGLLKQADYNAEVFLESGELITSAEDFWKIVSRILSDQQYLDSLVERGSKFYKKYMDNQNYPSLVEIVEAKTSRLFNLNKDKKPFGTMKDRHETVEGVINIDADPDFYYGEIQKQDFFQILKRGKEINNIELAILEYVNRTRNQYFREYALDPRRALGLKLLGDLNNKRVLDYGCGIGSLGIPAARSGAHVTFIDNCIPRLEMANLRVRQHNLINAQFFACKNWKSLPADLQSFDVIILNGILEWVASTSGSSFNTVIDTQLSFLFSMQQKLDINGVIFLAIENRFALQYFMGYPEDHTDIQYLSIMSREKANEIHLKSKGKEFTAWTWSLNDYKELLPKAGLFLSEGYAMFPNYRFPRLIINLEDRLCLKNGMLTEKYNVPMEVKERHVDYIYEIGLIEHFVYSYGLLLKKSS